MDTTLPAPASGTVQTAGFSSELVDRFVGYLDVAPRSVGTYAQAVRRLLAYFAGKGIDLVLSPDIGAAGRAKEVGDYMGLPYDHLNKTRLSGTDVKIAPATADVKGKNVLIVDDMISTGGTIVAASAALKEAGASSVFVACTHGVFVNNALERFTGSCVESVLSCNTLNSAVSHISVAGLVADALKDAFSGKW